jgi:hypothetical protein
MPAAIAPARITAGQRWLGVALLVLGLCGHLVSAYIIRMNPLAYPDHLKGFVFIAVVTGILIAGLGWLFWRRRPDVTWFVWCTTQTVMGLIVLGLTLSGMVH